MANLDCFALKDDKEFYIGNGLCYALDYPAYRKFKREGKCCTMACPFYKPKRVFVRTEKTIKNMAGVKIMEVK